MRGEGRRRRREGLLGAFRRERARSLSVQIGVFYSANVGAGGGPCAPLSPFLAGIKSAARSPPALSEERHPSPPSAGYLPRNQIPGRSRRRPGRGRDRRDQRAGNPGSFEAPPAIPTASRVGPPSQAGALSCFLPRAHPAPALVPRSLLTSARVLELPGLVQGPGPRALGEIPWNAGRVWETRLVSRSSEHFFLG